MADDATDNPMTPSGDYQAMVAFWDMVEAILGGAETMRALSALTRSYSVPGPKQPVAQLRDLNRGASTFPQSPYLPAFPNESHADYEMRRKHAPFTNIYDDIADNLASKPFSKELQLDERDAGRPEETGRGHRRAGAFPAPRRRPRHLPQAGSTTGFTTSWSTTPRCRKAPRWPMSGP
jgi:hypothetical protein